MNDPQPPCSARESGNSTGSGRFARSQTATKEEAAGFAREGRDSLDPRPKLRRIGATFFPMRCARRWPLWPASWNRKSIRYCRRLEAIPMEAEPDRQQRAFQAYWISRRHARAPASPRAEPLTNVRYLRPPGAIAAGRNSNWSARSAANAWKHARRAPSRLISRGSSRMDSPTSMHARRHASSATTSPACLPARRGR